MLTGFTVFATVGNERQRMNILADPRGPIDLIWSLRNQTRIIDNYGINTLVHARSVRSLFPGTPFSGFIGVYLNDVPGGGSANFAFGTDYQWPADNRLFFNPRDGHDRGVLRLGGPTNLTFANERNCRGFWGVAWDGTSYEVTLNGALVATGANRQNGSAPGARLLLGANGPNVSARHHGLLFYGTPKLSLDQVAFIYEDAERIMSAVGVEGG